MNSYSIFKKPVRKLLDTQNSQGKARPNHPRWLRRSLHGKNKRHIKKILDRVLREGYFSKNDMNAVREKLGANR